MSTPAVQIEPVVQATVEPTPMPTAPPAAAAAPEEAKPNLAGNSNLKQSSAAAGAATSRKRSTQPPDAAQRKFSLLEKEGKITRKLMDYYNSKNNLFSVEYRPNKKRSDGEWMCAHKMSPEDSWIWVKRIDESQS